MNKENKITVTIDTPAIGEVIIEVPYTPNDMEKPFGENAFVLSIPNRNFYGIDYTNLNLSHVVESDIKHFEKLNEISDENHQVYIDTLCIYGIKIVGNYIRIQYWFHQDGDVNSHRMCAGGMIYCNERGHYFHEKDKITTVYPDGYTNVCVYW